MRFASVLLLILCLAACQHGTQTNEAVRQGVLDHLSKAGLNVNGMDVAVSSVEFNGSKADAVITITPKGVSNSMPMTFKYQLEQQDKKWVVTGNTNTNAAHGSQPAPGANPHGGGEMPDASSGGANPHGGGEMPGASTGGANPHGGGAAMPSPSDLPPATKKK